MAKPDRESMPYRPCAGIVLLNAEGLVWVGRRFHDFAGNEVQHRWQMPQGGIDEGEDPRPAALRELYEETGVRSAEILAEARNWILYDLPDEALGIALKGIYRGQRQKWFAMRLLGDESEINLAVDGLRPEFDMWRWARADDVMEQVVPFKRDAYAAVFAEFRAFLK